MQINRQRIWLMAGLATLAASLVGVHVGRRAIWPRVADFHHPFRRLAEAGAETAEVGALMLKGKPELAQAVNRLQQDNEILRARLAATGDLAKENTHLRQLLALSARPNYRAIHAEVRGRDPLSWRESLIINRGGEAGVRLGAVVICSLSEVEDEAGGFAVVGRVIEVSRHHARVATLLSPHCRFDVLLSDSQLSGMAQGAGHNSAAAKAWIRHLPRESRLRVGEMVLTSGLSGTTPPGLLLGWLSGRPDGTPEVRQSDHLYQEAAFMVAADLNRLGTLLVLAAKGVATDD